MTTIKECPYCSGHAKLCKEPKELVYRKEQFNVIAHYYKCENCGEEFTTSETDNITLIQAHNQYREKYSIPFTDEIRSIREKYGLPATKMSEVLGLGINGYGNYEKGEIPTQAIGNLISLSENPKAFMEFLDKARHYFTDTQFNEAKAKVQFIIDQEEKSKRHICHINLYSQPCNFTGYKRPNLEKLSNLIVKFLLSCNEQFNDKLKLNKLLFYSDFNHYKSHGFSITGLSYRAIKYGPVPTNYDLIYSICEAESIISVNWTREGQGSAREILQANSDFDNMLFTQEESNSVEITIEKFKDITSWDIVDLSHKETAWQDQEASKGVIAYQSHAFDLKAL